MPSHLFNSKRLEVTAWDIPSRQDRTTGPRWRRNFQHRQELRQRVLGELAIGRQLTAENRQKRRLPRGGIQVENVVASHGRSANPTVVIKGPDTGVFPDDILRSHRGLQISRDETA